MAEAAPAAAAAAAGAGAGARAKAPFVVNSAWRRQRSGGAAALVAVLLPSVRVLLDGPVSVRASEEHERIALVRLRDVMQGVHLRPLPPLPQGGEASVHGDDGQEGDEAAAAVAVAEAEAEAEAVALGVGDREEPATAVAAAVGDDRADPAAARAKDAAGDGQANDEKEAATAGATELGENREATDAVVVDPQEAKWLQKKRKRAERRAAKKLRKQQRKQEEEFRARWPDVQQKNGQGARFRTAKLKKQQQQQKKKQQQSMTASSMQPSTKQQASCSDLPTAVHFTAKCLVIPPEGEHRNWQERKYPLHPRRGISMLHGLLHAMKDGHVPSVRALVSSLHPASEAFPGIANDNETTGCSKRPRLACEDGSESKHGESDGADGADDRDLGPLASDDSAPVASDADAAPPPKLQESDQRVGFDPSDWDEPLLLFGVLRRTGRPRGLPPVLLEILGGKVADGGEPEAPIVAAMRELHEELGTGPSSVSELQCVAHLGADPHCCCRQDEACMMMDNSANVWNFLWEPRLLPSARGTSGRGDGVSRRVDAGDDQTNDGVAQST